MLHLQKKETADRQTITEATLWKVVDACGEPAEKTPKIAKKYLVVTTLMD
jgi:hypothetical protein